MLKFGEGMVFDCFPKDIFYPLNRMDFPCLRQLVVEESCVFGR